MTVPTLALDVRAGLNIWRTFLEAENTALALKYPSTLRLLSKGLGLLQIWDHTQPRF